MRNPRKFPSITWTKPVTESFGATGTATVNGECYIGQNWDVNYPPEMYWDGDSAMLIRHDSSDAPDYAVYAHPGFLACAGMNSDGIPLSSNTVPLRDNDESESPHTSSSTKY